MILIYQVLRLGGVSGSWEKKNYDIFLTDVDNNWVICDKVYEIHLENNNVFFLNLIIHEVVRVYNKISVNVKHDVKPVNLSYLN